MEEAATSSKKRRSDALDTGKPLPPPTGEPKGDDGRRRAAGSGVDRISSLPDELLCEIISLLPTKDAARTQALASLWSHLWRAAPLNLDCRGFPAAADDVLAGVVSTILSAHPGPGRRFCVPTHHVHVPTHHVHDHKATVDAWLRSPALDNLQEINLYGHPRPPWMQPSPPPPTTAFRFSATLRIATIGHCHIADGFAQTIRFPLLKQFGLQRVRISEASLHSVISSCPALEYLLLDSNYGFHCVRINSNSLQSIEVIADYFGTDLRLGEIIVEDAPCLERFLCAERIDVNISVMDAPKLETAGFLSTWSYSSRLVFGSTTFQGLHLVSLRTVVHNIKVLAIDSLSLNLDMVIDLM